MAQPAQTFTRWSPAEPARHDVVEGPVADLHRLIETRFGAAEPASVALDRPDTLDALLRAVSRAIGWAALLGTLAALAAWLL